MPKKKQKNPASLKAHCQKAHFKKRLKERFGLDLCSDGYRQIIVAIQSQPQQPVPLKISGVEVNAFASFRARQSNRVTAWDITFEGITGSIPVIYDNLRKTLVTTYPGLSDCVGRRAGGDG